MGDVFASRNRALSKDLTAVSGAADFESLPTLSALMAGIPNQDGKSWKCPPHSLTLYLEGSLCKIVVGAGDEEPKFFGTMPDLSCGLQGVEKSLVEEKGEWKAPKGSKLGYPNRR